MVFVKTFLLREDIGGADNINRSYWKKLLEGM
jgi:hypothetical protein